jgi:CRISPR system Cascade subunit CasB
MSEKKSINFAEDSPEGKTLMEWWSQLEEARGDRAELRRCKKIVDVIFTPSYHKLRLRLLSIGFVRQESLALVAGVLSHVKDHNGNSEFAKQMASSKNGDKACVSGLRFRRLLAIRDDDDENVFQSLIRTVALIGGTANIYSLANSAYWWNERTKKQWAFDYYSTAPSEH